MWYNFQANMDTAKTLEFVGLHKKHSVTLSQIVDEGLTRGALETLLEKSKLSSVVLFKYLDITARAIQNYGHKDILKTSVSDRLIDIAALYAHGVNVFGSTDNFNYWLQNPSVDFDGKIPLTRLRSSQGLKEVENVLYQIEHGIPA